MHGYRVEVPSADYWRRQINCQQACPVHTDARGYVRAIADGRYEDAYLIARGPNPLASICGRVCGAPCEAACRRGDVDEAVSIRALKRFVTDKFDEIAHPSSPESLIGRLIEHARTRDCGRTEELSAYQHFLQQGAARSNSGGGKVAIIGSGPAGLAAAHDLALLGFRPTVYEMEPIPAGMLAVGIPQYRLPRKLIAAEVEFIRQLGVEFVCNTTVGVDIGFDEIREQHQATLIATGLKRSRALPLPGSDANGVLGGIEFLRDVALGHPIDLCGDVVVIGGGNVAYDVARTVIRQTSVDISRTALRRPEVRQVHLCSLESLEELPADDIEIIEGDEEGVQRHHSLGPKEILKDDSGNVRGVVFQRCVRVFDDQGRFNPVFDTEELTTLHADTVLWSIGQAPDLSFIGSDGDVRLTKNGLIECDPASQKTTAADVFVAGDISYGPRLLIDAVASGKQAARRICTFIRGTKLVEEPTLVQINLPDYKREADYEKLPRTAVPTLSAAERQHSHQALVEVGFSETHAVTESCRCLDCGINTIFDSDKCILCGGCADVCPELCLELVSLDRLEGDQALTELLERRVDREELDAWSAIVKDETKCIRCALCAERCPVGAITMERVAFQAVWSIENQAT